MTFYVYRVQVNGTTNNMVSYAESSAKKYFRGRKPSELRHDFSRYYQDPVRGMQEKQQTSYISFHRKQRIYEIVQVLAAAMQVPRMQKLEVPILSKK